MPSLMSYLVQMPYGFAKTECSVGMILISGKPESADYVSQKPLRILAFLFYTSAPL